MNYIPGFSNHLQTSVPRYAVGGPIMGDAALTPEQREARRIAANTRPQGTFFAAPTDNLGKGTGYDIAGQGSNLFEYRGGPVRVTDRKGNVLFSGEGPEGALAAAQFAQNLTDTKGKKASWDIQQGERTINPDGSVGGTRWVSGPTDFNEGSAIRDFIGTALPLAVMAIPGLGTLGAIGYGAAFGGAGAAFKGDDPLKGAAMGGLGAAGGKILGPALEAGGKLGTALAPRLATAVGTGIGSTVGGVATGQDLKDALIGGVLSGGLSYASPDISKALGVGTPAGPSTNGTNTSTGGGGGGFDGILVNATPAVTPTSLNTSLGGSPNKIQQALKPQTETPYDGLTVSGNRVGSAFGVNTGGDRFGAPGKGEVSLKELKPEDIVVDATTRTTPVSAPVTSVGGGEITPEYLPKEDIVVDATKIERPVTGGLTLSPDTLADVDAKSEAERKAEEERKKLGVENYLALAGKAVGLLGNLGGGGGKGSGSSGTYVPGGAGGGRLNPIFSAKLPAAGGLGAVGLNRTARPMGDVDWLTYGQRPELSFFDYAPQTALPTPITTPIPNEPAGPSMYVPEDNRFAKGGRTEFAVNGPGTGRSDDIPAVLSDGEYVIDAETVALLGDGSSKAGAKKLDDLRVKVRKHKGQKLAKGRFSANAKKPEAYLSGGRI